MIDVRRAKTAEEVRMSRSDYWYAAQVTAGMEIELEREIVNALLPVGTAFCPVYQAKRKKSRHATKLEPVDVPLFSKYLFVKFGSPFQNWGKVTNIKGVDGFIRANGFPLPIRVSAIEAIRNECLSGAFNDRDTEAVIRIGDHIRVSNDELIREGFQTAKSAFGGFEGTFRGVTREHSATIELSIFGRQTRVEIPTELIARIL